MTWSRHIDNITSKANSKLEFLKRNLKVMDSKLKETVYTRRKTGTLVWDPLIQLHSESLEKVQPWAAR